MTFDPPRILLYVPGDRPERFERAASSGADLVIVDLEDAVAPARRSWALEETARWLASRDQNGAVSVWVRVNAGALHEVSRLSGLPTLAGLVLPKVSGESDLASVRRLAPRVPLSPLIESAAGMAAAREVARAAGVAFLQLGELDLAADLRVRARTGRELDPARLEIALASRLGDLPAPPVPVHGETQDMDGYLSWAESVVDLGFRGYTCVHPRQVSAAATLTSDEHELGWARRVLEAARQQGGAFLLDGQLVDEPVIKRARSLLDERR